MCMCAYVCTCVSVWAVCVRLTKRPREGRREKRLQETWWGEGVTEAESQCVDRRGVCTCEEGTLVSLQEMEAHRLSASPIWDEEASPCTAVRAHV